MYDLRKTQCLGGLDGLVLDLGFESYLLSWVGGRAVSYASALNARRGLVAASIPYLASRCGKGSLQDGIPTTHIIVYLPTWYLSIFVFRVALILRNPFSASTPSLFLRKLAVLLVTWPVLDLAFSRAIPIFQINAVRQHSSQYKATWNHGLLTLGPCTHYTA